MPKQLPKCAMPATTPAKSRRLFAIWGSRAPWRVADDAASFALPIAVDEASTAAPEAGALPPFFLIGPNQGELRPPNGRPPLPEIFRGMRPAPAGSRPH